MTLCDDMQSVKNCIRLRKPYCPGKGLMVGAWRHPISSLVSYNLINPLNIRDRFCEPEGNGSAEILQLHSGGEAS